MRRTGPVLTASVSMLAVADLGLLPPSPALIVAIAACGWLLVRLLAAPAAAADRRLRGELAAWSEALVNDRSAQLSHDLVHWPRRTMREAVAILRLIGDEEGAGVIERASARCEKAAPADPEGRRTRDFGDPPGMRLGLIGGVTVAASTRSDQPLRRFSVAAGLPRWVGPSAAERLARLLRPVDLVRLLHTPEIERRALVGTLWLRAALVLAAPLTGFASLTGDVPLAPGADPLARVVFWLTAAAALAAAGFAPRLGAWVIQQPVRLSLLIGEQALALVLLATAPCWACCAYAAGPIVWFEKREWSLWKVPAWAVVNLGAVLAFAAESTLLERLGEAALGALVVALIATSYGLMLPAVATTLLVGWRQERAARRQVRLRTARSRRTVRAAIAETRAVLARAAGGPDGERRRPEVSELLDDLARAERRLAESAAGPGRRPRTLSALCARAIANAGVSPVGWDAGAKLHATRIECRPEELGRAELSGGGTPKALERLVERLVLEAVAHGRGLLSTRIERAGDRVVIAIANEVHPEHISGTGSGRRWADALAASLPDATVVPGAEEEFNGLPMWVVRVSLGGDCLRADT